MTIAAALWPRRKTAVLEKKFKARHFRLAPNVQLLADCYFHSSARKLPTLLIVHGLEGSSRSPDILNLAAKAFVAEMNVVCLNLRNCGDTLHLSQSLYNGGMSEDIRAVLEQLQREDGLSRFYLAGYSLGGNIVLKLGGELGESGPEKLLGICAISPAIDLGACVKAMEQGLNRLYEQRFLFGLKEKIRQKNKLFPGKFAVEKLSEIWSIRSFDNTYTAPDAGYKDAEDYYMQASSLSLLSNISVPTLILAAKDDPLVPFNIFAGPHMNNPHITLLAPDYGGHGGFLNRSFGNGDKDIFWAENRVIQFCSEVNSQSWT